MKKNDRQEMKTKTLVELTKMLFDVREEMEKLKVGASMKKNKDTNDLKNKRKILAKIHTFMSIRKMMQEEIPVGKE